VNDPNGHPDVSYILLRGPQPGTIFTGHEPKDDGTFMSAPVSADVATKFSDILCKLALNKEHHLSYH
jgi:hypothetical protein